MNESIEELRKNLEQSKERYNQLKEQMNSEYEHLSFLQWKLREAHFNADVERLGLTGILLEQSLNKAILKMPNIVKIKNMEHTGGFCCRHLQKNLCTVYGRTHDKQSHNKISTVLIMYEYESYESFKKDLDSISRTTYDLLRPLLLEEIQKQGEQV